MGKVFCFINGGSAGWHNVSALTEEGHFIAGHMSSTVGWAQHDIGICSDWKHDIYKKYYPDGYDLVWVDDPLENAELQEAYKKHTSMSKEEYQKTLDERLGDTSKNFPSVKVTFKTREEQNG